MVLYYWLISIMTMPNHPLWSRTFGDVTLTKYVGFAALGAAVLYRAGARVGRPIASHISSRLFLAYFAAMLGSYFLRGYGEVSVGPGAFAKLVSILTLFLATAMLVDSERRLRYVMLVLIGATAFSSLYVARQFQTFYGVYADFRTWGGVAGDPNYYALTVVLWMPTCLAWALSKRPLWERLFCWGSIVLALFGFTVAASRGGFLGLVAGVVLQARRAKHPMRMLFAAGVVSVPLLLLMPSSPIDRLLHPTISDEKSSEARKLLWKAAWRMFLDNPVAGVGLTNFHLNLGRYGDPETPRFNVAHNTYVETAAELGLTGLVPYLGLLAVTFLRLEKAVRRARERQEVALARMAAGLQSGLAGYAVCAMFLSTWWHTMPWLLVFLAVAVLELEEAAARRHAVAAARARKASEAPAEPVAST